ncbi:hypothetical protein MMC22_007236, partial [Lobaria immixta]|nr:hypothetical protein [Lobaria immixta]
MARKGKEPATQPTLRGNLTPSIEADSRGSREPERQELSCIEDSVDKYSNSSISCVKDSMGNSSISDDITSTQSFQK